MPVPTVITDLSTTAASNSPAGSDSPGPDGDNHIRALAAFIAQLHAGSTSVAAGILKSSGTAISAAVADTDYQSALTAASQAEMEAGTESAFRKMSPLRVAQAVNSGVMITQFTGVVADGTGDNTAAWQAAVTYAATLPYGCTIFVPKGTYRFTAQGANYPRVGIPSNCEFRALGPVNIVVDASGLANSGVNTYGTSFFYNADMLTTGNKNVAITGTFRFKSANATSGSTGNGGFIAFKNCLYPVVDGVHLLDTHGVCRMQLSFCYGAKLLNGVVDYETPHLTPWSFEDGIRVGSGCVDTIIDNWSITSGDDCIAINNEASECQDTFTTAINNRIPASNVLGANIDGVKISNVTGTNSNGNLVRLYIGPSMTQGVIAHVKIANLKGSPVSSTSGGSAVAMSDANSGSSTRIFDVSFSNSTIICSGLTVAASTGALWIQSTGFYDISFDNVKLTSCTQTYGITCSSYTKVIGCTIDGSASAAIFCNTGNCEFIGNTLTSTAYGIHLNEALHTRVIGNRCTGGTYGLSEGGSANYNICIANDFFGCINVSSVIGANSIYANNLG